MAMKISLGFCLKKNKNKAKKTRIQSMRGLLSFVSFGHVFAIYTREGMEML